MRIYKNQTKKLSFLFIIFAKAKIQTPLMKRSEKYQGRNVQTKVCML